MTQKTAAIVFGGKSTEHEVSIRSARNIAKAIDKFLVSSTHTSLGTIDVIFPIVHGTGGEDGTLQGLLKIMNIAFAGPKVVGSALCIDKEVAKRILNEANIPNSKFLCYTKSQRSAITFETARAELGVPMYIKPPNLGSSVGISKVSNKQEFDAAIDLALQYDRKVLIEENIVGREIECAVMGNESVQASPVGEVVTNVQSHTFYDYAAKYTDANGSTTVIPAQMDNAVQSKIQEIAIKTYKALCCEGMSRVDVFLTARGEVYVNEVNTLPGFTDISMYPKLWGAAGISYSEVISKLLWLALDRHQEDSEMKTEFL
jgi:D-alanine-D-alanine ligase